MTRASEGVHPAPNACAVSRLEFVRPGGILERAPAFRIVNVLKHLADRGALTVSQLREIAASTSPLNFVAAYDLANVSAQFYRTLRHASRESFSRLDAAAWNQVRAAASDLLAKRLEFEGVVQPIREQTRALFVPVRLQRSLPSASLEDWTIVAAGSTQMLVGLWAVPNRRFVTASELDGDGSVTQHDLAPTMRAFLTHAAVLNQSVFMPVLDQGSMAWSVVDIGSHVQHACPMLPPDSRPLQLFSHGSSSYLISYQILPGRPLRVLRLNLADDCLEAHDVPDSVGVRHVDSFRTQDGRVIALLPRARGVEVVQLFGPARPGNSADQ